jgi:hypothetical protein
MGSLEAVPYAHRIQIMRTHVQGFGVIYFDNERQKAHPVAVPIVDGRCVVEGKLYA